MAEVCPCCKNHCDSANLRCDRGREYFSDPTENKNEETRYPEEHRHHHGHHHVRQHRQ